MMSVPFGDSPSMVFHTLIKSNKANKKQLIDNPKMSPSISTATSIASSSKSEDNNELINTPLRNNNNNNNNYDISYYFNPSSSATTYRKAGEEEEEQEESIVNNRSNTNLPVRARSLSIGSTISAHYMNNSPVAAATATAFNEYYPPGTPTTTTSSQKTYFNNDTTEKSNKKAHQFFGEQVQLQITAKEVRKEGLKALLYSTAPLGYFLYHLLNEYSSENLFFYLAVDNYQSYNFPNHIERQQVANKIAKAYLTRNSELEVNLEDRISRAVKKALLEQQKEPHLSTGNEFDSAKRHVFSLLNVSYHRFRVSSIWDIMEAKCDGHNRDRAQALIVNVLLSFVKRHNNPSLFKLVHSFCRIYLPYGYDFRSTGIICREEILTKEIISKESSNRRSRSKSVGGSDKKSGFISSKIDTIFSKNNKSRTK